jgi:hypothetical protein
LTIEVLRMQLSVDKLAGLFAQCLAQEKKWTAFAKMIHTAHYGTVTVFYLIEIGTLR